MIKYFIVYHTGDQVGNIEIESSGPIAGEADIRAIERGIADKMGYGNVVITDWRRFETSR